MNMLTFERVWEDIDFFEIEVTAQTNIIRASVRSYTTKTLISELASKLKIFVQNSNYRFIWENGEKGDGSTPFISLEFWYEDKLGHAVIEVFMEIDDGGSYSKHNCCFYIKTEIGLLSSFGKSLLTLSEGKVGEKIALHE